MLKLGLGKVYSVVGALILLVNPLFFSSALTFMTDNYFLLFSFIAAYFYLKYFSDDKNVNIVLGGVFSGLAFLTRQIGLIPLIAFYLVQSFAFFQKKVGAKKSQNFDKIEITKNLPSSWLVK